MPTGVSVLRFCGFLLVLGPALLMMSRSFILQATPLLLTLAVVELSDIAFAVSVSLPLSLVILESYTSEAKGRHSVSKFIKKIVLV